MTTAMQDREAIGVVIDNRYRISRKIGQGGMGSVYEAVHVALGERVALKFPLIDDQEGKERFVREAWAAARLRGENVARVIDLGFDDSGSPWLAMDYLEGMSLGALLECGIMPVDQAVELVLQACHGVAEAHGRGIVHRDLKPDNLFITRRFDGTPLVKVLDFGLAKLREEKASDVLPRALTGSREIYGTPSYMPPEQMQSFRTAGPSADVWSLGLILYECLTGTQPFEGDNVMEICSKVFRSVPPSVRNLRSDVPPELAEIVDRSLRKDPTGRFSDAGAMANALQRLKSDSRVPEADGVITSRMKSSAIRVTKPRPPSEGKHLWRGPSSWPIFMPGLAMAYIDHIRVIYCDSKASEEAIDRMIYEFDRAIVEHPDDEPMVNLTYIPSPAQINVRHGQQLAEVITRNVAKIDTNVVADAVVAPSAVTRGIMQALDWISPRNHPRAVLATVDDACRYLGPHLRMTPDVFELRLEAMIAATR